MKDLNEDVPQTVESATGASRKIAPKDVRRLDSLRHIEAFPSLTIIRWNYNLA